MIMLSAKNSAYSEYDFNDIDAIINNQTIGYTVEQKLFYLNYLKDEFTIASNTIRNNLDSYVTAYSEFREHMCDFYRDPTNPDIELQIRERFNRGHTNLLNLRNEARNIRSNDYETKTCALSIETHVVNKLHIKIEHIQDYFRLNHNYTRDNFDLFKPDAAGVVRGIEQAKGEA
jgi:hypothetical protein